MDMEELIPTIQATEASIKALNEYAKLFGYGREVQHSLAVLEQRLSEYTKQYELLQLEGE